MLGGGDSKVGHPLSFPPVLGRSTFGRHQRFTGAIRGYARFTTAETPGGRICRGQATRPRFDINIARKSAL
jgi:hypothetical protein